MGGRKQAGAGLSYACALETDTGRVRENNEDFAIALPEAGLFVVADGMGGHAAGEVASHLAVETLVARTTSRQIPKRIRDEVPLLGDAITAANLAVYEKAQQPGLGGMGTTLTAALIRGRTLTLAHVGDSRAYLQSKNSLRQLTHDQTLVALLIEQGKLPPDAHSNHPDRHVLTQAIGSLSETEPELLQVRLPGAARLLLCSDGLHDVVSERELGTLVARADLDAAARALVQRANDLGGPDNVTVLLVQT